MTIRHLFDPRTSNTRSIETRTLARTYLTTRGTHGQLIAASPMPIAVHDCTGRPDNSGNKRPPRSPRGVPWLPKATDLASKFHQEPPWRRSTLLVLVGSVHPSSRVCCYHSGLFKPKQPNPNPPTVQPDS
ncbi:hypothetical protein CRG98_006038 [Punica granatum]|uniref:Uncharacterized protein n=1 Tax=Punica granatum TaxID=22663 RepID=A0A2I0KZ41_PUNGR|nr:hypothetical protein CRG98_006038 [Punica granatum]